MSLMTPCTAQIRFYNMGTASIVPAFSECLWYQDADGKVNLHYEGQTSSFTFNGTTYNGSFSKGTATGSFLVDFNSSLAATDPQFWWPPDGVSQQPPDQNGQGRFGVVARAVGLDATAVAGFTRITPYTINQCIAFLLDGPGKTPVTLGAQHFTASGPIQFYCDLSYMIDQ